MDMIPTPQSKQTTVQLQRIWVLIVIAFVIIGIFATATIAYGKSYDNRVLPGVRIGAVPVGGMTAEELGDFLEDMNSKLVNDGIEIHYGDDRSFVVYPPIVPDSNIYEILLIETDKEIERFLSYRKYGGALTRGIAALSTRFQRPSVGLEYLVVNEEELRQQIAEEIGDQEQEGKDAAIVISSVSPLEYQISSSTEGVVYDVDALIHELRAQWTVLEPPVGQLRSIRSTPSVVEADIQAVEGRLEKIFSHNGLVITYIHPQTQWEYEWEITTGALSQWIEVQKQDNELVIGIARDAFESFVDDKIVASVEVEPVDAKFDISAEQKVEAFRGSRPGVSVDRDALYANVNNAIVQRNWHDEGIVTSVPLTTVQVEPNVKTGEVNDLGITEILGAGYSNFAGSPPNRVKNVRFAIEEKLNGLLIKPGETFSLLDALRPFTIEGGYLPELVIKGTEIVPEVGGGLCQVGSTMFRAAMNSGLPIVERRNHSLVVGYYNDHRNGLPGTDATIYDSAPDFKFENDTGNYILLTTDMNEATGDLWFTLWGTGTGKKGYYTEPVVEQWIPAGERRVTKTTELAPGVWRCQGAHTGAVTSFTYVIEQDDGTTEEQVFRSHYRPLPEICLVGATQEEIDAERAGEEGAAESEDVATSDIREEPEEGSSETEI